MLDLLRSLPSGIIGLLGLIVVENVCCVFDILQKKFPLIFLGTQIATKHVGYFY